MTTQLQIRHVLVAATIPVFLKLGSEFMPPLREGSLLYMPSAVPAAPTPRIRRAAPVPAQRT